LFECARGFGCGVRGGFHAKITKMKSYALRGRGKGVENKLTKWGQDD